MIEYLGRYSHKVAISNHRIKEVTDKEVCFGYKRLPQRRGEKGNDSCKHGVCPEVFDAYFTEKICKDPALRHPEQQLEARETTSTAIRFKDQSYYSKTENFAPEMPVLQGGKPDYHCCFRAARSATGISFRYPTFVCELKFVGKGIYMLQRRKTAENTHKGYQCHKKKQSFQKTALLP